MSTTMKYSKLAKNGRIFHNLQEVDETLINANRIALQNTLEELKKTLRNFIRQDVYNNVHTTSNVHAREIFGEHYKYHSKWGGRTNSLLDDRSIETYVYNAFGKGVGGGIKFNDVAYDEVTDLKNFIHGNKYFGELAFTSYLEMLNNSRTMLVENPYHFPTGAELYRRPFWADFRTWVNFNYKTIFEEKLRLALGGKVKIGKGGNNQSTMNPKNLPEARTFNKDTGISEAQIRADYASLRANQAKNGI